MSNWREEQRKTGEDAINRYFAILEKIDPFGKYIYNLWFFLLGNAD